ncbi:MAG: Gfo/Idh/MocA family oxidoreductase [Pirellulales bacterium]
MIDLELSRRAFVATAAAGIGTLAGGVWGAPPPSGRIRIGQIGVGHAHASKLSVYRASPDYEVVGVVEPDEVLRKQSAGEAAYRDLPWMTLEQLLNTPDLQAVLVETRVRDLLVNAEACITAGKHIHLDKPAGESLPHLKRILESARRQQLLVQMGYMYRYNPGVVLLKEFLRQGWLGDIFEVHAVMSKVIDPADRAELAGYPGGIMFELGCHILDLVIGVLGEPETVTSFSRHSSPVNDNLLDNMLAVLEYGGAIATVKSSAEEIEGMQRRHLVVCGTKGTFHLQPLDNPSAQIALSEPRGDYRAGYQDVDFPRYVRYVDDAADMARIIRGEKAADFSYDHDLAMQRTLLKACRLPVDS